MIVCGSEAGVAGVGDEVRPVTAGTVEDEEEPPLSPLALPSGRFLDVRSRLSDKLALIFDSNPILTCMGNVDGVPTASGWTSTIFVVRDGLAE